MWFRVAYWSDVAEIVNVEVIVHWSVQSVVSSLGDVVEFFEVYRCPRPVYVLFCSVLIASGL